MTDLNRILGRLEEFQRTADKRFDKIEAKLEELASWKLKVVGGVTVVVAIVGAVFKLI